MLRCFGVYVISSTVVTYFPMLSTFQRSCVLSSRAMLSADVVSPLQPYYMFDFADWQDNRNRSVSYYGQFTVKLLYNRYFNRHLIFAIFVLPMILPK